MVVEPHRGIGSRSHESDSLESAPSNHVHPVVGPARAALHAPASSWPTTCPTARHARPHRAVVVVPPTLTGPETKAVNLLVEDVTRRAGVKWQVAKHGRAKSAVVAVGPIKAAGRRRAVRQVDRRTGDALKPEGFHIRPGRRPGRARRRQRRARRALRRRPAAPRAAHEPGPRPRARRASSVATGPNVSAPRPPARLSAQDQLLRRLGPAPVGAVHPRPGRLRHQRRRADSAALRRRRRQPALPAAADGDDGRHVAAARRLRPGRLDLVSGDGHGLLRSEDRRVRARGVGRGLPQAAADRRGLRARRRPGPHAAQAS